MGVWRLVWLVLLFGVVSVVNLAPPAVSAEAVGISGKIELTGEVPSWTYLILDKDNNIQKIFSNGNKEGTLLAAQGSMSGTQVSVTPELIAQYEQLKPALNFHYGYIYEKSAPKPKTEVKTTNNSKLLGIIDVKRTDVNNLVSARPV